MSPGPQTGLLQPAHRRAKPGEMAEVCPAALSLAGALGARVAEDGIAALFIDYGPVASAASAIRCRRCKVHRFCDPLEEVGAADLTAHVDFAAMARRGARGRRAGPRRDRAGDVPGDPRIRTRAALLSARANEEDRAAIAQAMTRLIDPRQMGSLFKALAIASRPAGACRLSMITLGVLGDLPGIRHGFMTRAGGVSEGIYDSLNCGLGSDDDQTTCRESPPRPGDGRHPGEAC